MRRSSETNALRARAVLVLCPRKLAIEIGARGQVSKMFTGRSIDTKGLSSLLSEQSKLVMQSSPDAASMAKQFLTPQVKSGGITGFFKRLFGSG